MDPVQRHDAHDPALPRDRLEIRKHGRILILAEAYRPLEATSRFGSLAAFASGSIKSGRSKLPNSRTAVARISGFSSVSARFNSSIAPATRNSSTRRNAVAPTSGRSPSPPALPACSDPAVQSRRYSAGRRSGGHPTFLSIAGSAANTGSTVRKINPNVFISYPPWLLESSPRDSGTWGSGVWNRIAFSIAAVAS